MLSSILHPVPPWEMGTTRPDSVRWLQKHRLLHHHLMASAPLPDDKRFCPRVCHAIRGGGVPQREGWDAFTGNHPLSASIWFTNVKSTPKTLGISALDASESPCWSSPSSLLPPSHASTLHNI